jgi:acetyl esterase/lipase
MGKQIAWLALAMGMLAMARFAVRPARTYRAWRVALISTELGHLWCLLALVVAALAGRGAGAEGAGGAARWVAFAACAAAVLAAAGFARPPWQAWRVSRRTRRELATVFGPDDGEPLWSWRRLWRWPTKVARGPVEVAMADGLAVDFYPACRQAGEKVCHQSGDKLSGAGEARARGARGTPCVVLVHGGGWDGGDRTELAVFNHWLAERGVAVVAFDYRLAPAFPWPAQRDDLRTVVGWVRENAARLGVDPERITLVGRSAGAQIAVATAYGEKLPGVRAVVALYGVHNLEFVWSIRSEHDSLNSDKLMRQYLGGPPEGARLEAYRSGSGELLAHADAPPTLIVHGALDEMVWCRHSEKLAAALKRAGAPHVFVRLPWATHAGEANLHGPAGQLITGAVLRAALAR